MDRDHLRTCATEELIDGAGQLGAVLSATHAALLDFLAVLDEREVWRADGCGSFADWISFKFGVARRTAHEWAEAARSLEQLPHLARAYCEGSLSWDKAKAVASLATAETDEALTTEARATDATRLESAARRAKGVSLHEAQRRHHTRFFAMRRSRTDGGVKLSGYLPDVDGEIVIKAIELLAEDIPKDPDTGLYPPFDQRCADALVELAGGQLEAEREDHGERALVVAHIDLSSSESEAPATSVGELESEIVLAPETADRLMCDAVIEPVFEDEGRELGRGKKSRKVSPRVRRKLKQRDRFCRFPGCTRLRLTECHHKVHRSRGGPDDPDNLVLLCRFHHRKMHEGGWTMLGDPNGRLEFIRPDGKVLSSDPPRSVPRCEIGSLADCLEDPTTRASGDPPSLPR